MKLRAKEKAETRRRKLLAVLGWVHSLAVSPEEERAQVLARPPERPAVLPSPLQKKDSSYRSRANPCSSSDFSSPCHFQWRDRNRTTQQTPHCQSDSSYIAPVILMGQAGLCLPKIPIYVSSTACSHLFRHRSG